MAETAPLVPRRGAFGSERAAPPPLYDASTFRQMSISLIAILLAPIVGTIFATVGRSDGDSPWTVVSATLAAVAALLAAFALILIVGLRIWDRGSLSLERDASAGYVRVEGARVVEYYSWGSGREDATVLVCIHGSGQTGKHANRHLFPPDVMKGLNVRAISPSLPGHGGSDAQPRRRIKDWPLSDLAPILDREGVSGRFLVVGTSYGTAHAMATASVFGPDRVAALGLNVPYLPEPICREVGMWTDADMILREARLEEPWVMLPVLALLSLVQGIVPSGLGWIKEGPKTARDCPDLMDAMRRDARRCFLRGVNGQAYEMLDAEVTQAWPDPRGIEVENVAVWYAGDDSQVPPEHGRWLAENLAAKARTLRVRSEARGYGHFTYMTPEHCSTGVMTKELLEMDATKDD